MATELDETIALCKQHGLDVARWIRPEKEIRVLRSRDRFVQVVRKALAEATRDAAVRNELERRIITAFQEHLDLDAQETIRIPRHEIF
jgi:hypothetical protein